MNDSYDNLVKDINEYLSDNKQKGDVYPENLPKKYETLEELIKGLGIVPKDMALYEKAFSHASYTNEHSNTEDYDRLEFLGDGVLDLIVGDLLYREYPTYNSGMLTRGRSQIVEGKNLSDLAVELGFAPYIRFSEGEKNNAAFHGHIYEDVFEAFIGALYLENGFNYVYKFIKKLMRDFVKGNKSAGIFDWKSKLQEEIQAEFKSGVTYEIKQITDENGKMMFSAVCKVDGVLLGSGTGHNKKEAMKEAAKEAFLARKRY